MSDEANSPHHEELKSITGSIFGAGMITGAVIAVAMSVASTVARGTSNTTVWIATAFLAAVVVFLTIRFGMRYGEALMRQILLIDESKDAQIRELLSGKDIIIEPEGNEK